MIRTARQVLCISTKCLSIPARFEAEFSCSHQPQPTLTGRFNQYILNLHPNPTSAPLVDDLQRISAQSGNLHHFDQQCCAQFTSLPHPHLLRLLLTWTSIQPHSFSRLAIYEPACAQLCATYLSSQPLADFLSICHLLGAAKKRGPTSQLLDAFVRRHFNKYADRMSALELAILAAAVFRSAVRLQRNHDRHFERAVLEMSPDQLDVAVLVALLKALRLARQPADRVAAKLAEWMRSGRLDDRLELRHIGHLLVYFADNRLNAAEPVQWLSQRAGRAIRDGYAEFRGLRNPIDMRGKDFAMILWSWAQLNVQPMSGEELLHVAGILKQKVADGEFEGDFDGLVDASLSLWQIGLRSRGLVRVLFEDNSIGAPPEAASRAKLDSRKRLLRNCVELERPEWLLPDKCGSAFQPQTPAKDYLLRNTPNLRRIEEVLRQHFDGRLQIGLVQPIRDLNIPGIVLREIDNTGELVHFVEVAETTSVLSDQSTPFGLLALKMRLLRARNCRVLLVNPLQQTDEEIVARVKELLASE